MSELPDARHILEMAERAAIDGDLSTADELLRDAARVQEATLGPLHPELATTLNNLAIVAEKTGRPDDAEMFYRRAASIAATSLPADHPMVAESRQNLEDFCRERGSPIAAPAVTMLSSPDNALTLDASLPEVTPGTPEIPGSVRTTDSRSGAQATPPSSSTPSPVARTEVPAAVQPLPDAPRKSSRQLEWVAIGAIALVTVAVFVRQPWSARETSTAPPPSPQATTPALPTPALPPPAKPAPIEQAPPPTAAPRSDKRVVAADKPRASSRSSGDTVSLASVQLCQTFSTSGGSWRCDPPGESVVRGPIVLYTRVRSSRDATVVHRWYREDTLRQAVKLTIRANASEGYRTYSRQNVDGIGNWRVEVRSADGKLLHEQRFAAR